MSSIRAISDENDMIRQVRALERKNAKRDMKMLIRTILETPVSDGEVYTVDDVQSITELAKLNTDVRTRILLAVANDASRGDIKAAELLLKYGGYMPVVEQNVSIRLPQIINDLKPPESDELIDVTPKKKTVDVVIDIPAKPLGAGVLDDIDDDDDGPPIEFIKRMKSKV